MELRLDTSLAIGYKSNSQKIRVMSESWISENMYCPCCGNQHIIKLGNNSPVADMQCENCGEIFELKSKEGNFGNKINDGAYSTMIDRITSITNPDLFAMNYNADYYITNLVFIPKFFFVPYIIERRKPLASTARRANWVGCNILYSDIPKQGKITIIQNGLVKSVDNVVEEYNTIKRFQTRNIESRGWMIDVLNCLNKIQTRDFSLSDVYDFVEELQLKHINNNNVKAKIRQQLQILRDRGFIEFLGNGIYRKIL